MMTKEIVIIGGGLAGLSVAYHLLLLGARVTLFEKDRIGAGASGVGSGLLHPFVGEKAFYSERGDEGMAATKELLDVASKELGKKVFLATGITRFAVKESQWKHFIERSKKFNLVLTDGGLFIPNGMTVFMPLYLQGLLQHCQKLGLQVEKKEVGVLPDGAHVVLAAGAGIFSFGLDLDIKPVKGQVLRCKGSFERSMIGKGYLALTEDPGAVHLGSTYEHHFENDAPDLQVAKANIFRQVESFLPNARDMEILECLAAVRVCKNQGYFPIAQVVNPLLSVFTGLGSRGLLYHALLGKELANAVYSVL